MRNMPSKRDSANEAVVAGVRITHPDKVLWPAAKGAKAITKLDLAHYYEAVAPRMLLHIAGRPISMVRAPDGIAGQRFFQRHALMGGAARFHLMKVKGETKPFLAADTVQALVALAQAAVLEIHPWGSKKDDPETPARIVFDLDPAPDVKFDAVVVAAKEFRTRLTACGLVPFVKTTGGKGMHVVVAIKGSPRGKLTWREAKDLAKALCKQMERDSPKFYTTTLAKNARRGKIFLDYLRNDRFASSVAPWSPRARDGAPVAMPLDWSKVKPSLDSKQFNVGNVRSWLKTADPWKDLDKSARSLEAAARKLVAK
jgi:bifunctional non-homologous end joining protein LigD